MTKEALLDSGTVKVLYLYSEDAGAFITEIYMNLGGKGGDFMDYTNCLNLEGVRDKYTNLLNEKIKKK